MTPREGRLRTKPERTVFRCGFLTVTFLFALPVLEALTIPAIVVGNILAALVMGGCLWRRHPLDLRKLL